MPKALVAMPDGTWNAGDRFTSRKFLTMLLFQAVWIGLLLLGELTESGFVQLSTLTIGGFFVANAATHFAKK